MFDSSKEDKLGLITKKKIKASISRGNANESQVLERQVDLERHFISVGSGNATMSCLPTAIKQH